MTDIVVRVANTMPNLLLLMVNCTLSQAVILLVKLEFLRINSPAEKLTHELDLGSYRS